MGEYSANVYINGFSYIRKEDEKKNWLYSSKFDLSVVLLGGVYGS